MHVPPLCARSSLLLPASCLARCDPPEHVFGRGTVVGGAERIKQAIELQVGGPAQRTRHQRVKDECVRSFGKERPGASLVQGDARVVTLKSQ